MSVGRRRVIVLDYGSGNIRSALRAAARVGMDVSLSADPHEVAQADGLIVPGVGAFAAVMRRLREVGAPQMIRTRLQVGRPVLGICVGMQVLCESSTEHGGGEGLGLWSGQVRRLDAPIMPHMGWSEVRADSRSDLLAGLDGQRFYFVHSYALTEVPLGWSAGEEPRGSWSHPALTSWAHHGQDFVAAAETGPLSATQFHPEKSGDVGLELLGNWARTL